MNLSNVGCCCSGQILCSSKYISTFRISRFSNPFHDNFPYFFLYNSMFVFIVRIHFFCSTERKVITIPKTSEKNICTQNVAKLLRSLSINIIILLPTCYSSQDPEINKVKSNMTSFWPSQLVSSFLV